MIGRTISHYHVIEKLGEGGMGVVYKAQDTLLNRLVALKVLPAGLALDPERRARLLREAQAASALSHPNIATVHDVLQQDEGDVIVMELAPGRTLDQLIPRKGMPLAQALKVGVQVASALEAAHEAGIVHRDLKPGNIMVGDDGRVRVLDFGLAKVMTPVDPSEQEATRTRAGQGTPGTRDGQILGTASYMSPEQAEGRAVDARSDIFSFGAVLYEMVVGHRPFRGTSSASTLAAILKDEPERLPGDIPHDLEKLIERCLRKDPQRRTRHMADVRLALEDLKEESDSGSLVGGPPVGVVRGHTSGWRIASGLAVLVVLAMGAWWWRAHRLRVPGAPTREVPFTTDPSLEVMGRFSPDGSTVVFTRLPAIQDRTVRAAASVEAKVMGSESTLVLNASGYSPVFSPDGRWVAFYGGDAFASRARIEVVPRIGGTARGVAEVGVSGGLNGIVWTSDNEWLISTDSETPDAPLHLALVSVQTGEKRPLTTPPADSDGDRDPALSPDGRTLAFTRRFVQGVSELLLQGLDAGHRPVGEPRALAPNVPNANSAVWTPDAQEIVFCSRTWHAATLWRARADGSTPARPLGLGGRGAYSPDIDSTGTKLLYTKHVWDLNVWRVALLPSGLPARAPEPFLRSNLVDEGATFSPDGRLIAFTSERSGSRQIWLSDPEGASLRPLTSLNSESGMDPSWSPDGGQIAFSTGTSGGQHVYVVRPEGGAPLQLTSGTTDDEDPSWSPDGRWVRFTSKRGGESRIWKVPRGGGEPVVAEGEAAEVRDPSGAYLYRSEEGKNAWSIRRRPMGGGTVDSFVQGASNWAFAVSRAGIYFTQGQAFGDVASHIAFREFGTGPTSKVADLRPGSGSGGRLSVSPDGRHLLYTQCDEETSDLVLVENFH